VANHLTMPYFQHEVPFWTAKSWSLSDKHEQAVLHITDTRHFLSTLEDTTAFTSESPKKE